MPIPKVRQLQRATAGAAEFTGQTVGNGLSLRSLPQSGLQARQTQVQSALTAVLHAISLSGMHGGGRRPEVSNQLLSMQYFRGKECEADSQSSSAARSWSILQCLSFSTLRAQETTTHDRAHGAERIRAISLSMRSQLSSMQYIGGKECEADSQSSSAARSWCILQCLPFSTVQA